ncbi:hypothetical protein [Thioclava sp. F42-5]|uniref:hypothetical protein n=1 Tax=Thioclava sp. F42-5 TaxID=1973005 RepID=UPI00143D9094|nr:hypothetical protein [Thioclava sp. F42-5]
MVKMRSIWIAASVCLVATPMLGLIFEHYGTFVGRVTSTAMIVIGVVMLIKHRS